MQIHNFLTKIASIYKVGLFVLSIYALSFIIVTISNFINYLKNK
jgi:hypothetical protein